MTSLYSRPTSHHNRFSSNRFSKQNNFAAYPCPATGFIPTVGILIVLDRLELIVFAHARLFLPFKFFSALRNEILNLWWSPDKSRLLSVFERCVPNVRVHLCFWLRYCSIREARLPATCTAVLVPLRLASKKCDVHTRVLGTWIPLLVTAKSGCCFLLRLASTRHDVHTRGTVTASIE